MTSRFVAVAAILPAAMSIRADQTNRASSGPSSISVAVDPAVTAFAASQKVLNRGASEPVKFSEQERRVSPDDRPESSDLGLKSGS